MTTKTVPTYWAEIAIAGNYDDAVRVCRSFCDIGLCVTIQRVDYVYTRGVEAGVIVRLINYPRFEAPPDSILDRAMALADRLREDLFQDSYTIITPTETHWVSMRTEDARRVK